METKSVGGNAKAKPGTPVGSRGLHSSDADLGMQMLVTDCHMWNFAAKARLRM